jgi:hypothetical protein
MHARVRISVFAYAKETFISYLKMAANVVQNFILSRLVLYVNNFLCFHNISR